MHQAPSFVHAYSFFVASLFEQRILFEDLKLVHDEQFNKVLLAHFARLQRLVIKKYRACSEEEKQKRFSLNDEEQLRFEQTIVYPASMMDALERKAEKQKTSYDKKVETLEKDKASLERKNQKLNSGNFGCCASSI